MGLRSFVALPVESEGGVLRTLIVHNQDSDNTSLNLNFAYGLSRKDTLLVALPYSLSNNSPRRIGDVNVLYRRTISQQDFYSGTSRLAVLVGGVVPADDNRDYALSLGIVNTRVKDRYEIDSSLLYITGLNDRRDNGRYDVSWQYRLSPTEYPEWGFSSEWNIVMELNGRWHQGQSITHQITSGIQWINRHLVVEGGVFKAINNSKDIHALISTRFHF